jgi:hypothetical protein
MDIESGLNWLDNLTKHFHISDSDHVNRFPFPALSLSLPFQFLWQGSSLLERAGARALTIDSRTCFQCLNLDQR